MGLESMPCLSLIARPVNFDGGDYQRGPEAYLNPPKPKVYRGDHGQESDYDNPKPLYIPKQILVHLFGYSK